MNEDVDQELVAEAREQRRRWRFVCPECRGGWRAHSPGCPEAGCDDEEESDAND